jgi:hypothetical protein
VLANGKQLLERQLNPRAARGFRDVSVPLEGGAGLTELRFDLRLTDRDGRDIPAPSDLLIGVADPVVHDLDDYGKSKGVVLISIDTLRRDHVGAYGYPKPTTPRLDALAQKGLLAQDAVSTSSWTLPAHLSMLTSADPGAHGGVDHEHKFNGRLATLPGTLQKAGWATHAVTSHLYVSRTYGLDAGFDHLDFHQDRKATETADKAIALLERVGDRPFFLFLHFYDPHWHYDPPEKFRALFATGYQGPQTGLWQSFKDKTRATTKPEELQHLLALYDGEIRYTDDEVGRILDHVAASGLSGSTLVVVTSDHGEEFLEHGSWEHQKTLYEEVVRVPLIVHGPGVAPRVEKAAGEPARRRADDPGLGRTAGTAGRARQEPARASGRRARGLRRDRPHDRRHAQAVPARGRRPLEGRALARRERRQDPAAGVVRPGPGSARDPRRQAAGRRGRTDRGARPRALERRTRPRLGRPRRHAEPRAARAAARARLHQVGPGATRRRAS